MPAIRPLTKPALPARRLVVATCQRPKVSTAARRQRPTLAFGIALALHAALAVAVFYVTYLHGSRYHGDADHGISVHYSAADEPSDKTEVSPTARPAPMPSEAIAARIPENILPVSVPIPELTLPLPVSPDTQAGGNEIMARDMAKIEEAPARDDSGGSFFGTPLGKGTVVIVLDVSSSMAEAPHRERIRQQALDLIGGLSPAQKFNVIAFAQDADMLFDRPEAASRGNKAGAAAFLSGYYRKSFETTRTGAGLDPRSGVHFVPIQASRMAETRNWLGPTRLDIGLLLALKQHPDTILAITDGRPRIHGILANPSDDDVIATIASTSRKCYPPLVRPAVHSYLFPHSKSTSATESLAFLRLMQRDLGSTVTVIR